MQPKTVIAQQDKRQLFTAKAITGNHRKGFAKRGAIAEKASQGKRQLFTAKAITGNHRKSFAKPVKTISAKALF